MGYNPNEPRVPAGSPEGGEWTDEGDVGFRFISQDFSPEPKVGEVLPPSQGWDEDRQEPNGQELPGTSSFGSRADAERYAQYSHGNGWMVELRGEKVATGDLAGERLLKDAKVVKVERW